MSFATGLDAFSVGFRMIRQRNVRSFVWAPAVVSLAVITICLSLTLGQLDDGISWLLQWIPDWLDFLSYVLIPLAYLFSVLFAAWLFGYLATIVASPFLGVLAARVEQELLGVNPSPDQTVLAAALGAFARELRKFLYYLPRALAVLALTLLPVINALAPFVWILFGAWMLAVQFSDYVGENHNRPFSDTLSALRGDRGAALGFGAPSVAILSIPLLNFIAVPIAVVGGTVLRLRITDDGKHSQH